MGLAPEAAQSAKASLKSAWLDAVRGRALVLDGKLDDGIALLKASESKLDEGRRGDALYWLGRSLTQKEDAQKEVETIVATLAARPGFVKESKVLEALLAQRAGNYPKARTMLEPLARGPEGLPLDIGIAWLLVDACAGMGEAHCVDEVGGRALARDGDAGRLQVARAATTLVGKTAGVDVESAFREAHRLTPFDA